MKIEYVTQLDIDYLLDSYNYNKNNNMHDENVIVIKSILEVIKECKLQENSIVMLELLKSASINANILENTFKKYTQAITELTKSPSENIDEID